MRGRKEALWAVAISAALITAGFTLSCGDDNGENGGAAVSCQEACEKLDGCWGSPYIFGYTVADCVEACEEELGAQGGFVEVFECIPDTDCRDILGSCLCKPACEKIINCEREINGEPMPVAMCVGMCEMMIFEEEMLFYMITCSLRFSSCQFIMEFCAIEDPG